MGKSFKKLATLATGSIIGMHFINKFIEQSSTQKHMLKTDTGHFFQWQYGNIFYTMEGHGEPCILIHNLAPESSGMEWKKIKKELSVDHTVYTIDLPGCGRSDKPNLTYTNFLFVEMLNAFINKNINHRPVTVIATEDSSSFVIMAANLAPELYSKIILVNPPEIESLEASPNKGLIFGKFVLDLPVIGTFLYNVKMQYNNIDIHFNRKSNNQYQLNKEYVDSYYESAHLGNSSGRHLYSSKISNYTNINVRYALGKLKADVILLLSNQKDGNQHIQREYKALRPEIKVATIPNSKGIPQIEVPNQFLSTLEEMM